ncbi:MAG: hypothetical protein AB1449_11695 [Chloroflexota bacterium]
MLYNAYAHWREETPPFRPFDVEERSGEEKGAGAVSKPTAANRELVREFNAYLTGLNQASLRRRRAMAVGYALSGIIALASMVLILAGR